MPKQNDIYVCSICGNVVEATVNAGGTLSCCGKEMDHNVAQTADSTNEKHVPILEAIEGGTRVTVGSTEHPMTEEHSIQWIEIINGTYTQRKYLKPGDKPMAEFYVPYSDSLIAREYCNLHGLWANK